MSRRILSFSQVIEQERRRWMPFKRALSNEDQEAFDRMFGEAAQQLQADIQLGRPWRFETLIMAVLLAHAQRLEQIRMHVAAFHVEQPPVEGNLPQSWR
jgi:hypothetical protein